MEKGVKERSSLSQNQLTISVFPDLQMLGKITNFHAGGSCLGAEEKIGPSV